MKKGRGSNFIIAPDRRTRHVETPEKDAELIAKFLEKKKPSMQFKDEEAMGHVTPTCGTCEGTLWD